jgi:hydrogenase maturation protein HypF
MELEAVAEKPDSQRGTRHEGPEVRRARSRVVGSEKNPMVHLPFPVERDAFGMFIMDPLPLLSAMGKARQDGVSMALLATGFHRAVARTSADLASRVCEEEGLSTVALCGGVFQNALLLGGVKRMVEEVGLRVLVPRLLSPNDGSISYGQVAVAAARLRTGKG